MDTAVNTESATARQWNRVLALGGQPFGMECRNRRNRAVL